MNRPIPHFAYRLLTAVAALLLTVAAFAPAADRADEGAAQVCVACHGARGNAPIANYPKLAGQNADYLLYAMRAYKSGKRANAIMTAQMQNLQDDDLQELAAYFAAQKGDLR